MARMTSTCGGEEGKASGSGVPEGLCSSGVLWFDLKLRSRFWLGDPGWRQLEMLLLMTFFDKVNKSNVPKRLD